MSTHTTGYPARAYAAPTPERLNYLIDPDWGGETPRALVIRVDGSRTAISGELTAQQLRRLRGADRRGAVERRASRANSLRARPRIS